MTKSTRAGDVRGVSGEGRRESRPEGAQRPEARKRGATIGLDLVRRKAHRGGSSDQLRKLRTDRERNRKATEGLASALVEEIRVEGQTAAMRGSEATLAQAVSTGSEGIPGPVPRFGPGWSPGQDSNRQGVAQEARKPPDGAASFVVGYLSQVPIRGNLVLHERQETLAKDWAAW
jgi:hypothetical protein